MKISTTDRDIHSVLTGGFYVIPRFQRPYSWDKENVFDFWTDINRSDGPDYFIGSMVVFKMKDGYGVVDGQQRLTTITMLLAAIRNSFAVSERDDLAAGIQTLIEKKDVDNVNRFILKTETSFPYFHEHIQKLGAPELPGQLGREEQALRNAFTLITGYLNEMIASVHLDPQIEATQKQAKISQRLADIRDRLLSLKLILIEVDDENDAYNIFETLNTRGKDLAVSDLVKNHFSRLIKPPNKGVDVVKTKWASIIETIEESSAELRLDTFLHHYWLSKHDYVTIKQLFKQFRKKVTADNAKRYLDELVSNATTYRQVHETSYRKWLPQQVPIRRALEGLSIFGVTQQTPMSLAIVRAFDTGALKPKDAARVLGAIEKFHFMVTAVASQPSSGGISAMYSLSARKLTAANTELQRIAVCNELISKLAERVPSEDEFVVRMEQQVLFSDQFTKQRRLVKYVLGRIFDYYNTALVADLAQMTVEHLLPQSSVGSLSHDDSISVAQVGNMILVPTGLNSKLASKTFAQKKAILVNAGVKLDKALTEASSFDANAIRKRTKELAKLAYRKLWAIDQK